MLRLLGLKVTVGAAGWQTAGTVTVKVEPSWTVCDGFVRAALAVIEYRVSVEGAEVGVTVSVVVLVTPGATERVDAMLAEIFAADCPPSAAVALIENEVVEQALPSLFFTQTI